MVTRREILSWLFAATGTQTLSACGARPPFVLPLPGLGRLLVDAHAHLFNATDLPVGTFLEKVVLPAAANHKTLGDICGIERLAGQPQIIAEQVETRGGKVENETLLTLLVGIIKAALTVFTPSAQSEAAALRRQRLGETATILSDPVVGEGREQAEKFVADRLEEILERSATRPRVEGFRSEDDAVVELILEAAGIDRKTPQSVRERSAREIASAAFASKSRTGSLLRFVAHMLQSRASLADDLAKGLAQAGTKPRLLVPLMVDYSHWLLQNTATGSHLPDQVAVFREIALRRTANVAVHGMVAFDPLRAALFRAKRVKKDYIQFDPLRLVDDAVHRGGFLGVKLYPPMGFKAYANKGVSIWPQGVAKSAAINMLGARLDREMAALFDYCSLHDVPIIAHCTYSIGNGEKMAERASPHHWVQALNATNPDGNKKWLSLRVCLAHQGGFDVADPNAPSTLPAEQRSWEWTIGRHISENPDGNVYVDISYLSEIFDGGRCKADRKTLAEKLHRWRLACDPDLRHVIFGTDWTMISQDQNADVYGAEVLSFLQDDCKLTPAQLDRVLYSNALRYFGLVDGTQTMDRMRSFYKTAGIPISRLPYLAA